MTKPRKAATDILPDPDAFLRDLDVVAPILTFPEPEDIGAAAFDALFPHVLPATDQNAPKKRGPVSKGQIRHPIKRKRNT